MSQSSRMRREQEAREEAEARLRELRDEYLNKEDQDGQG